VKESHTLRDKCQKYAHEARTYYGKVREKHQAKQVHKFCEALIESKKLKGKYAISQGNATDKTSTKIDHVPTQTYAGEESPQQISGRLYSRGRI